LLFLSQFLVSLSSYGLKKLQLNIIIFMKKFLKPMTLYLSQFKLYKHIFLRNYVHKTKNKISYNLKIPIYKLQLLKKVKKT